MGLCALRTAAVRRALRARGALLCEAATERRGKFTDVRTGVLTLGGREGVRMRGNITRILVDFMGNPFATRKVFTRYTPGLPDIFWV
jgi:hypothetical protein